MNRADVKAALLTAAIIEIAFLPDLFATWWQPIVGWLA